MNAAINKTSFLEFRHVYSHPGDMAGVAKEFYSMFEKIAPFLQPLEVNTYEGLGWVLLELLNNAVRSPVSLAMNAGMTDIVEIDFYTDIVIRKTVTFFSPEGATGIEISVMNRGILSESVLDSIGKILNGELTVLDCEEQFMLKGSCTGNGGLGIILSKKQVENALGGTLSLSWHDGFYDFTIRFTEKEIAFSQDQ
jgi:hypothetical protein